MTCIFNHNKPGWEVVCSEAVLYVEPHCVTPAQTSACCSEAVAYSSAVGWAGLDCVCSKTWIASECVHGGSLAIILNGLNLLTRRNHWIQLELLIKTVPSPKRAEIRFLYVRKPCANTMLNSLLVLMVSLQGSSQLFLFLGGEFSVFQGMQSDWVMCPTAALILSVLDSTERIWENLLRFSYLLRYFSFWTFSHRELFCTALGAHHCMVQAVRSCFWGTWSPLTYDWVFCAHLAVGHAALSLIRICLLPTLTYMLSFELPVSGQTPVYFSIIFYSVLVTVIPLSVGLNG